MQIYLIFVLILSVLIAVFALMNTGELTIELFFWKIQTSVPVLILVSVATGALVMFLLNIPSKIRSWRESKKCKEQIRSLEEEKLLLTNRISELTKKDSSETDM
ncbi:MAG: LapA family protein [bacterium]